MSETKPYNPPTVRAKYVSLRQKYATLAAEHAALKQRLQVIVEEMPSAFWRERLLEALTGA